MSIDTEQIHKEFASKLKVMLELVAKGRGIEILIRIADQTKEGLKSVADTYEKMLGSDLKIPNLHPPQALPNLFTD